MSRDEQHLAEQFILGQERAAASRLGVAATGKSALGVKKKGGAALGVKRGPQLTPRRCNICSWFERRKVIKDKGHKCPKAAKDALAGLEKKMNGMQLARAVERMLREAEEEEEDEYEPPAEGEASSSKGVLKKK